jgi:hypothetical protein
MNKHMFIANGLVVALQASGQGFFEADFRFWGGGLQRERHTQSEAGLAIRSVAAS